MDMLLNHTSSTRSKIRPAGCSLALLAAALIFMAPASVQAALVAYDDFDTAVIENNNLSSRTISTPGWGSTFPSSTQVFGVTDRAEAVSKGADNLLDTSLQGFDPFGILKTTDTSSLFAVERPGDSFSATWEFDLSSSGNSDLSVGIDFAAMGNWGTYDGAFTFTASADGGQEIVLFQSSYQGGWYNYYMENDTMFPPNPMQMENVLTMNGTIIDNDFKRLYADITEFADVDTLTIKLLSDSIGDPNVFAFDNIGIYATVYATVPVPGTVWLLGAGFLGFIGIRRRYQN